MANSESISYMILKSSEDLEGKSIFVPNDEVSILRQLVEKFKPEGVSDPSTRTNLWIEVAKEYAEKTGYDISVGQLQKKWNDIKEQSEEVRTLEASIAKELGTEQQFQVQQINEGDQTSTTIVLLEPEAGREAESKSDLISLALTQSGIEDASSLHDNGEYEALADEILYGDSDPGLVKKKLKWNRKFRVEETNFERSKKTLESKIEAYKRDYDEGQRDIYELERLVRAKCAKLEEATKELAKYK